MDPVVGKLEAGLHTTEERDPVLVQGQDIEEAIAVILRHDPNLHLLDHEQEVDPRVHIISHPHLLSADIMGAEGGPRPLQS